MVKKKKVALTDINLYNDGFASYNRIKCQCNVLPYFTESSKTPSVSLFLRAVLFTRHGHVLLQLSGDPVFYAFLI